MTNLLTPETFEFFAKYLLAGYVVFIVRSWFVLGLRPKPPEVVVEAIVLSLINQLVFFFVWPLLPESMVGTFDPKILLFAEVLVFPTVIGILLGWNLSRGWNNAFLRRLSAPIVHPVQRAHDFAFGNSRPPSLVIVTYEDGTTVRGFLEKGHLPQVTQTVAIFTLSAYILKTLLANGSNLNPGGQA